MSDIVEKLREGNGADWQTSEQAAAEIERLILALARMKRSRDRYRKAWEAEKTARAASGLGVSE